MNKFAVLFDEEVTTTESDKAVKLSRLLSRPIGYSLIWYPDDSTDDGLINWWDEVRSVDYLRVTVDGNSIEGFTDIGGADAAFEFYITDGSGSYMLCINQAGTHKVKIEMRVPFGNYYYNTSFFPPLPEWDKKAYPYAYIINETDRVNSIYSELPDSAYFYLYLSAVELIYTSDKTLITKNGGGYDAISFSAYGSGTIWEKSNVSQLSGAKRLHWCNTDTYNDDGTLYMTASEPFPVYSDLEFVKHDAYVKNSESTLVKHDFRLPINGKLVKYDACVKKRVPTPLPEISPTNYLTFSSPDAFTLCTVNLKKNWDGTLYYSNDGIAWCEWDGKEPIPSVNGIDSKQCVHICGSGNRKISGSGGIIGETYPGWILQRATEVECHGNIESLLDYETVDNGGHPPMDEDCFRLLFCMWTYLKKAPELPATILSDGCYYRMFAGCTGLTEPPTLPSTKMANGCYGGMFLACTGLVTAPELPATTLASECYSNMFGGCTNMTSLPALPAAALNFYCYSRMFDRCSNIKISETQVDEYQTAYRMPTSGLGTAEDGALNNMFTVTGGTFTGTPEINKTYYTSNTVVGSTLVRPNLASLAKINILASGGYTYDNFKWRIAKTGGTDGLIFVTDELTVGETYTFSYKFQKVSGTLSAIGGHCEAFTQVKYTVDGVEPATTYINGTPMSNDTEVHEVVFTGIYKGTASNKNLYVQVNRKGTAAVTFDIWDVKVEQGDTATPWLPAEADV